MFILGIAVLYTTSELKVIRRYLLALSITDVTHVAVCYYVLGIDKFMAVGQWNSMMWGNIAMPVCSLFPYAAGLCILLTMSQTALFLLRVVHLLGLFGPDKHAPTERRVD